ncbi:CAP domain-containing protein [Massilia timonae]|uniref:CAP domain-containing protein n=1 Tax=Massilia timonae TaxID=47229 RepID=UPI002354B600|nr:CAP domain-containing protein [Massilia timonae]
MSYTPRWQSIAAILGAALALSACGGGGGGSPTGESGGGLAVTPSPTAPAPTPAADAPTLTGNIAVDGRNWINYRRAQAGVPTVSQNAQIDNAALGHSEYLRINNLMSHDQKPGLQGFTGAKLEDRLNAAGYTLDRTRGFAYGEVISGSNNGSGFFMTEELITAIYHRFVIFEPMFREIGTGAASASRGYHYFTADFASRNGYGPGIARGAIVTWPFNGQTGVAPNFLSDTEEPDPVPDRNEVGYPISVHTNLDSTLAVNSFTVRPRGGADLQVLRVDPLGQPTAASIIPVLPLRAATTYEVNFTGTVNGAAVSRAWSFTTR